MQARVLIFCHLCQTWSLTGPDNSSSLKKSVSDLRTKSFQMAARASKVAQRDTRIFSKRASAAHCFAQIWGAGYTRRVTLKEKQHEELRRSSGQGCTCIKRANLLPEGGVRHLRHSLCAKGLGQCCLQHGMKMEPCVCRKFITSIDENLSKASAGKTTCNTNRGTFNHQKALTCQIDVRS